MTWSLVEDRRGSLAVCDTAGGARRGIQPRNRHPDDGSSSGGASDRGYGIEERGGTTPLVGNGTSRPTGRPTSPRRVNALGFRQRRRSRTASWIRCVGSWRTDPHHGRRGREQRSMSRILVTGGAGFIGSHVVDAFVAAGADVLVVDSLDQHVFRSPPPYLNPKAEYCFADLRHVEFDERFGSVEAAVVHLAALGGVTRAAREPDNVLAANCVGTARLARAMTGWRRLFAGLSCVRVSASTGPTTSIVAPRARPCVTRVAASKTSRQGDSRFSARSAVVRPASFPSTSRRPRTHSRPMVRRSTCRSLHFAASRRRR